MSRERARAPEYLHRAYRHDTGRERADNPTMRPEYVARVILSMPAVLRRMPAVLRPARIAA